MVEVIVSVGKRFYSITTNIEETKRMKRIERLAAVLRQSDPKLRRKSGNSDTLSK